MKEQSREICGSGWGTGNEGGEEMELKKGGGGSEGGEGVSNLLWILVSHLISGVVHRGATGVTPVLLTIVAAVHI